MARRSGRSRYDREAAPADGGVPPDGVDEPGEIDEDEFQRRSAVLHSGR